MGVHEELSAQFYQWEARGRGWQVWPEPVELEPPFRTLDYFLPKMVDDGRRESFLGSLARGLFGRSVAPQETVPAPVEEPEPESLIREEWVELQTLLPAKLDIPPEAFRQFLLSVSRAQEPIAFELLGLPGGVTLQWATHPDDAPHVRRQLSAFFPEAIFQPRPSLLIETWQSGGGEDLVVEFGLAREFMLPLAAGKLDPFTGLIGALSELEAGDLGVFQVLFRPARHRWGEAIVEALALPDRTPLFVNAPELTQAARVKAGQPLFGAVVRIGVQSLRYERAVGIARDLAAALAVFGDAEGNELIPLSNEAYPFAEHVEDLLRRQTRRSGMLLTSEELIGFVHLPSSAVRSPALVRQTRRTKAAPASALRAEGVCLGTNEHLNQRRPVFLSPEQRLRHVHITGASGTGKSTLLFNLIRQDIAAGDGAAVLDPHGDLVDRVLGIIPPERVKDVVLIDPADESGAVGFNILSAHSDLEKTLLASDLVSVFQRLSTSWGDQMGSVLNNAILTFLESPRGGTLADLRRFLLEPKFRAAFLETLTDPELIYYWREAFPQLTGNKSIGPVLTRLETFLSPKPIRYMVSQRVNRLDFANILDTGKIFLAKLSQGLLGKENSYLLGTLLVAKFQQLTMARQAQREAQRRPFWFYLDEFHQFITPSLAEILSGARKYRLGLTLAHQELRQLQRDAEVASAVLSNPGTRICFRLGDDDARKLAEGFASFEARDLQNLEKGQAICRIERSDQDLNLAVPLPELPDPSEQEQRRQAAIAASRATYATPRAEIEAALRQELGTSEKPQPAEVRKPEAAKPAPPQPPAVAPAKAEPTPAPIKPPVKRLAPAEPAQAPSLPPPAPASVASPKAEPPSVAAIPAAPAPKPAVIAESDREHEAIKDEIRRQAEALDYTVTLEEFVAGTQGRVDVVLRRGKRFIACEVSVTTTAEHEAGNIAKCLRGNYSHVAAVCSVRSKLAHIKELVNTSVAPEAAARVGYYRPAEFLELLPKWAEADPAGGVAERAKLRKQRICLGSAPMTVEDRKQREAQMLKDIAATMKRRRPAR